MANNGIKASELKYFEDGYLAIGDTNSTAGAAIVRMTSFSFTRTSDTSEIQSFDSDFEKASYITSQSWEASAEAYFTEDPTGNAYSGISPYVTTSATDAEDLLDRALDRNNSEVKVFFKIGSSMLTADAILSSFEFTGSVGEATTYSISLQGSGSIEKVN